MHGIDDFTETDVAVKVIACCESCRIIYHQTMTPTEAQPPTYQTNQKETDTHFSNFEYRHPYIKHQFCDVGYCQQKNNTWQVLQTPYYPVFTWLPHLF